MKEIRDLYPPDRHRSVRRHPTGIAIILVVAGVLALGLFEAFALLLRPQATILFRPGGLRELTSLIVGVGVGVLMVLSLNWLVRKWAARPRRRRRVRRPIRMPSELQPPVPVTAARRPEAMRSRLEIPVRPPSATARAQSTSVQPPPEPPPTQTRQEIVVRSRRMTQRNDLDPRSGRNAA
jgi:hypothetical protein